MSNLASGENIATPADAAREERKEMEQRLRLFHILAHRMPLGRTFGDAVELEMWCTEKLRALHVGLSESSSRVARNRLPMVVAEMWAAIEAFEESGATTFTGHAPILLDAWRKAWRKFQRDGA